MKCTVCKVKLERQKYEGVTISVCPDCKGALVPRQRMKNIQTRRTKDNQDLVKEYVEAAEDTLANIDCPECYRTMWKHKRKLGSQYFYMDTCKKCDVFWLDKGEIAKVQIAYQQSVSGMEANQFQERWRNLSDESRAEINQRISELGQPSFGEEVIRDEQFLGLLCFWYLD